jgi:hypothetical protein
MTHKREYIKQTSTDGSYGIGMKFVVWENNTFPDETQSMSISGFPKSIPISGGPQIAIFHSEVDADEYVEFKNNKLKDVDNI